MPLRQASKVSKDGKHFLKTKTTNNKKKTGKNGEEPQGPCLEVLLKVQLLQSLVSWSETWWAVFSQGNTEKKKQPTPLRRPFITTQRTELLMNELFGQQDMLWSGNFSNVKKGIFEETPLSVGLEKKTLRHSGFVDLKNGFPA